ncbi:enoyl-CoA hydratase/isomerase family protein [Nocardioides sp. zg-579]|uniref:3-hydroxyisobutyryl-CoA hydrolase n=1 Tax=Nocardioides marmotae TaxID=2663857 RepID=A0A6I3JEG2_9ACTN|nr:enoyl-CoA hydratase/isomerase family protein [Nocardioides marmotae]MCR6032795.1 enoyl-CoA hydratase/isomerase family protein [Gordonia jinghuaiqii]MTB96445.1 enoyl-CoA hydratase/isomerase family protein [Nocardioides marmotae]QKE02029.1 enoyl-CoA hydratase/isomerase family protein [Nocardioides marmotae]
MSDQQQDAPAVVVSTTGRLGRLELNRPRAINALNHEMVGLLQEALDAWREDDAVRTVLLTGRGERGLCAGGDIVSIWKDAKAGTHGSARFWSDEYVLNHAIKTYPKPYVAVMDGIVLGGGIGVSAHASHRVVTERSSLGMPETGIGFVPDVGGTWLLSHAPGELGTHLGLTAGSVGPGDAIALGLADHFVPSERLEELARRLAEEDPDAVLADLAETPPEASLPAQRSWIDECYAGDDAAAILARLREHPSPEAQQAARTLAKRSPFAVTTTLRALREAAGLADLGAALAMELRLTVRFLDVPDFVEGVRAQVIDKDRNPQWQPASLDEVDPAAVAALFEPLPTGELALPTTTGGPA